MAQTKRKPLGPEQLAGRAAYLRKWRAQNPERVRQYEIARRLRWVQKYLDEQKEGANGGGY